LVTSLAADTGKVLWHYKMSGTAAMSPSLFGGILYVGTHDPKSVLVALDPATGQRLWQAHVRGGLRGSPVVIGNLLYVGLGLGDAPLCTPGAIRVFNARTGEPGPRWFVEGGGGADGGGVWGPISYDGRQLLFGTGNTCKNSPATANAIVGMSPGLALNFSIPTKMPLDDDDVAGGIMVRDGVGYVIGKNGVFYAVDLASGRVRFSKWLGAPDGNGEFASPSFAASTLIVGGGSIQDQYSLPPNAPPGGRLYGLGLDGSKKWLRLSKWPVTGYVATSHGVAFADIDDKLDALDPATGAILWSYPLQGISVSSPAIGPSGLFATDLDGFVYAFGLPGRGAVMPSASAQVLYHLGRTPRMPVYCRFR
jgi:eukaryotic-like serine/threonine-protein kinase